MKPLASSLACLLLASTASTFSADPPVSQPRGDRMAGEYFRAETAKLSERCLTDIRSLEDWRVRREKYRQQLFEMLSLSPLPERTDLKPVVTGKVEEDLFTVEKLHFQSLPGLYATANLYLPKRLAKPAPAILYVCGHGPVITNGVSYGNKVAYQHHGAWFARNGYVCLILDTIQLGEIQGLHHGTYREGMWWWNSRGYTSAGVEAWNSMRAVDYLQTRPEVDPNRIGVTGRSGGGAYSWWVAALDDRIKCAAPVAGITDLQNHVVDGAVEGHCDCMFVVNTYGWDYPLVAALVAPRPLLIGNSDKDSIFPLDGVVRLHSKVRGIYQLYNAGDRLGLLITEGPHKDTQDLQLPVFRWFNRHLKGEDPVIDMATKRFFGPEQLKVFATLPPDERTTRIHETFVPRATVPSTSQTASTWTQQRDTWLSDLKEKKFGGWPTDPGPLALQPVFSAQRNGIEFQAYEFDSQPHVRLRLYLARRAGLKVTERVELNTLDDEEWVRWLAVMRAGFANELAQEIEATTPLTDAPPPANDEKGFTNLQRTLSTNNSAMAYLAPRGAGLTAWTSSEKKRVQIRRRFMLLGQTLDGMRVWDVRRGVQALRAVGGMKEVPLGMSGKRQMAANVLYASLFEQDISRLDLWQLPKSHQPGGPDYLNVLRVLDIPQAIAMALERSEVHLFQSDSEGWIFPAGVMTSLGWDKKKFAIELLPSNHSN